MGDRNNPIKFGPEWLRNLPGERREATAATNNQSGATGSGTGRASATSPSSNNSPQSTSTAAASAYHSSPSANQPKVLLAKLRYGREEMLALYERNSSPPPELKTFDLLYQPRGKPPFALSNTFEDEMRENIRSIPPAGMASNDRYGSNRGRGLSVGRGVNMGDLRGRRGSSTRQPGVARGGQFHSGSHRSSGYTMEDELNATMRPWISPGTSNGQSLLNRNNNTDNADWATKMYRNKRPGTNTNWRQSSRDDSEEWRSNDTRVRGDKWERDWGERRRNYNWDSQNSEDVLPEWAVENSEAFGGSFDSSGAFHGFSNDDSNLPKSQESSYPLTKSHTHGNFTRSKTVEEGSEEWWSSEKAKKLSPKRFDASDVKFKKQLSSGGTEVGTSDNSNTNKASTHKEEPNKETPEKLLPTSPVADEKQNTTNDNNDDKNKNKFTESKTFDALMSSGMNIEDAGDERGNFQSVMITPNNSLRQKHQNIVTSANDQLKQQQRLNDKRRGMRMMHTVPESNISRIKTPEEAIVDDMFGMSLQSKNYYNLSKPNDLSSSRGDQDMVAMGVSQLPSSMQMAKNALGNSDLDALKSLSSDASSRKRSELPQLGMQNSALNASLGLPLDHTSLGALLMQGVPPPVMQPGVNNLNMMTSAMPAGLGASAMTGLGANVMQSNMAGLPGFQGNANMPGMSSANDVNSSLFFNQNNNGMKNSGDLQMANQLGQNMFSMHGLQQPNPQAAFGNSMYGNIMQQQQTSMNSTTQNLMNQWYYEDPKKTIQGPFTSKEMYNWYRAGFFSPSLMVRRACDSVMRPLGSYGPIVPFAQMDMMNASFSMAGYEQRTAVVHDNMLNPQSSLGCDVMTMPTVNINKIHNVTNVQNLSNMQNIINMTNMQNMTSMLNMSNISNVPAAANMTNFSTMPNVANVRFSANAPSNSMPMSSLGIMRQPLLGQPQQMVESLWGQSGLTADYLWMQQAMNTPNNMRVNNLPLYYWGNQPSAVASNSLLPEVNTKEMKTEDEILAHLRASQPPFVEPSVSTNLSKTQDTFTNVNATPNLEELQKLMQVPPPPLNKRMNEIIEQQVAPEKNTTTDPIVPEPVKPQLVPVKSSESKIVKQIKSDVELKAAKNNKEVNNIKNKTKKPKEEKKEELVDAKTKDEEPTKTEKRSAELSPSQSKKEDKLNLTAFKKNQDKERKDWIKDGFTIVKGADKAAKDIKKKAEEARATEEAERKRKEEEKLAAAEEEKKKKQAEALKKQSQQVQVQEQQQVRQVAESVMKKAPWSAVANQAMQATNKDGLSLAEIQRLEREKKLEQMKEQQQMMQIIANQQAAALAREQEMQAGVGWTKKKGANMASSGQSLTEIQAETWKQAAAISPQLLDEPQTPIALPPQANHVAPWANTQNGVGGFWDTQPNQPTKQEKPQESPKPAEPIKTKKKVTPNATKKENSPTVEFENWCTSVLSPWSSKIDVPTFVGFLKDIESPYEVKDYVRCYLGDSKESNDFSRHFLERRSKLLRVGMVTPSDDLCSPALAVNPRTPSSSEYQEVKGKGKKTKKNKMFKVDSRILGFSVTAAEDRINVGDIDTVVNSISDEIQNRPLNQPKPSDFDALV